MREILFRGKRLDNGAWETGSLVIVRMDCHDAQYYIADKMTGYHTPVDPSTVGQYTGLKDRNGKRVFEGDIVTQNWYDHDEPSDDSFGEVVFCEYDCSFSVMDIQKDGIVPLGRCHAYHWEAEVIGNITDNPELLEK